MKEERRKKEERFSILYFEIQLKNLVEFLPQSF